jgi:type IV pilus assembly protein PilB
MQSSAKTTPSFSQTLITKLLERGILSADQVDIALQEQKQSLISFEDCLLNLGFLSENVLAEALASTSGYERVNLKQVLFDSSLKPHVPREAAEKYRFIPLSLEKNVLRVAIADVYNVQAIDFLYKNVPSLQKVIPFIAPESDILEAIDKYYGYDLSIRGLLKEIESSSNQTIVQEDYLNPTIRLVNAIILDAIKRQASDIHFEPEGAFMRLRYRIDGILTQVCTLHSSYWPATCVRLKVMAEMNIAESRHAQNGRITFYVGSREIDLRVSSHPTIHGENIVVRILDKGRSLLSLNELGYSGEVISQIRQALARPEGIFIITGPTGCGKTTSLYSMLSHISTPCLNIMTLEEPVEYRLPLIRQSDIRDLGGMDFSEGVRSILRQDPDIILIGEIRDSSTAQMALRASMTGHQVFSTLHTNDALGALPRLTDLGLSRIMLAGNLVAVVAQRLVRKLCSACKKERKLRPEETYHLKQNLKTTLFEPMGCQACHGTGYRGRLALAEVLIFDETLNELLITNASRTSLKNHALEQGYIPMAQDGRQRILNGDTSLEEVLRMVDLREGQ